MQQNNKAETRFCIERKLFIVSIYITIKTILSFINPLSTYGRAHCYCVHHYCLWYSLSLKVKHSTNLMKIWQKKIIGFICTQSFSANGI
jgi:hypothetical protein